jgi:putative transposase
LLKHLMQQVHRKLRRECTELLQLLDSSSITVKGPGAGWAKHTRTRHAPGVKLHLLLGGAAEGLPCGVQITDGNVQDLQYARTLRLESGTRYVFDKGYCDYRWWWQIEQSRAYFVTRFKRNAKLEVVKSRKIAKKAGAVILKDEEVRFANKHPGGGRSNPYTKTLRRIEVAREGKAPLVLASNDMKSSASKIAENYKQRWQIELFFKWIKQHLRIKRLLGRSKSAVCVQILTALIAYLLVAIYARTHGIRTSLWMLLAELRSTLFQRTDSELFRHRRWRERRSVFESMQADLFA